MNAPHATEPDTPLRSKCCAFYYNFLNVANFALHMFYHNSKNTQKQKIVLALDLIPQLGIYPKKIFQQEVDKGSATAQSPALETRY